MPIFKQFASAPKPQKPGNVFFCTVILIGVALLIWIWSREKPPKPQPKAEPVAQPAPVQVNKPVVIPTPVLVMTKTNFTQGKTTNAAIISQVNPPLKTVVAPPIAPLVVSRSNEIPSEVFAVRPVQNVFEAQVALARQGISAGSIDGVIGSQTRAALRAFQQSEKLPVTGELDPVTKSKLVLAAPPYTQFVITTNDLARLHPVGTNWLSKSQQSRLDYETILELVAEKTCCHPNFIKQLNPAINWNNIVFGTSLRVVNLEKLKPRASAAFIRVRLAERTLEAFDANTNLIAHFPCSIAQRVEKRPVGELRVAAIAPDPVYTFDPEVFPESAEARQLKTKLILPPGPNNPVGTVWIGLDKAGYGIHGTPKPEDVGRTESHGCFRLANWNAEYLLRLVTIGTPVVIEP